jgi:urease accessory protein
VSGALQRTRGVSRIAFKNAGGATALDRLFQSGAAKIRLPHAARRCCPQAVLINTAGGLTGGDQISASVHMAAQTRATVTTQACEKVYRSVAGAAESLTFLDLAEGARLDWIPQETILFEGGRLSRRLEANLAADSALLAFEGTIFGRAARNETISTGLFKDSWRIRREGRLAFADELHFDWADAALLGRPAVLAGGAAMATVLLVSNDAERPLESVRAIIGEAGGASA